MTIPSGLAERLSTIGAARPRFLRRRIIPLLVVLAVLTWGLVAWRTLLPPIVVPVSAIELTDMVLCPSGTLRRSGPPGSARIDAFYIDRFEVTRADFARFLEAHPKHPIPPDPIWGGRRVPAPEDADLPVTHVSLLDAKAYAAWREKRLPTSDEWEWAARGPAGLRFPWGEAYPGGMVANTWRARFWPKLTPVGLFESGKSPFGVYDMVGNVEEWTITKHEGFLSDSYFVRGGSHRSEILDIGTRGGTTILDTHRPTDSGTEPWEPIADRMAGETSWANDRGFRCVIDDAWIQESNRINDLVKDLGARDPASWLRRTRPALRELRRIGPKTLPALRRAATQTSDDTVYNRLHELIRVLEADSQSASS